MTLVGIDDTDSRTRGMCTTYLGAMLAERLEADRVGLIRLAPSVDRKTRGNAAVVLRTAVSPEQAHRVGVELIDRWAATEDPNTSPGLAVTGLASESVPAAAVEFTTDAVRSVVSLDRALAVAREANCRTVGWDGDEAVVTDPERSTRQMGWGRIGAVAAIGAFRAFTDETYERLVYRPEARWGTDRAVDEASLFAAAEEAYPAAWDTVDRTAGEAVCVPHTPGPVLFGIRGDDPSVVERVSTAIDHEPAERARTFVTNQGTDAHIVAGEIGSLSDGRAYRVTGVVTEPPETREGGHVFCTLAKSEGVTRSHPETDGPPTGVTAPNVDAETPELDCVAFEPTKRFRDRVRGLRPGDRVTVCGEISESVCKLEKFALREPVQWATENPSCPHCGRSMESAGRNQGYRCRDCDSHADGPAWERLDRALERGWYEVPPRARRHVAKPLVRGGFDAPVHPER